MRVSNHPAGEHSGNKRETPSRSVLHNPSIRFTPKRFGFDRRRRLDTLTLTGQNESGEGDFDLRGVDLGRALCRNRKEELGPSTELN